MRRSTLQPLPGLVALLFATLCSVAPSVYGQERTSLTGDPLGRRTVSVVGDASERLAPDHVVFVVIIETSAKEVDSAREENDKRLGEMNALASRLGIAPADMQQDYLVIQADYLDEGETPRFAERTPQDKRRKLIGYTTWRRLVVTLRQLNKVEELVAEALKLGVNYVSSGEFRVADMVEKQDKVRLRAMDDARMRANAISEKLGMKVLRPLKVSEGYVWNDNWWSQSSESRRSRMMRALQQEGGDLGNSDGEAPTMLPREILINARVNVVFEIE